MRLKWSELTNERIVKQFRPMRPETVIEGGVVRMAGRDHFDDVIKDNVLHPETRMSSIVSSSVKSAS